MAKQLWKPSTMLNPVPVVMVSCGDKEGNHNIITIAWAGTINSEPPMVSISVRKERFSHKLIKDSGEFVVNLVTEKLAFSADFCGVKSGANIDKFENLKLTKQKGNVVNVPLINESPVNIECVVKKIIELGSHDLFLAEVVAVNVNEDIIDEKGKLRLDKAKLICYSHGEYFNLKESLGYFGFSVTKKKILKRTDIKRNVKKIPQDTKEYTKKDKTKDKIKEKTYKKK